MASIAWVVPVCPLLAFLLIGFGARRSGSLSAGLSIAAVAGAFALSAAILFEVLGGARIQASFPWLPIPVVPGASLNAPAAQLQYYTVPLGLSSQISFFPLGFQV